MQFKASNARSGTGCCFGGSGVFPFAGSMAEGFEYGVRLCDFFCSLRVIEELSAEELAGFTDAQSIRDFETKVCKEMGLIDEIIPRYRTTYFNHIFNSGYSAGYYSYLWSEVLDCDAFEYFEKNGIYDKSIADRFRRTFLERGGSEEPMTLFLEFRGQEPDPGALLRKRGLE